MANNSNLQAIANQYIEFAKQVYESARASQDASQINDAISKLQALLQEVQKTYNEFNTSSGRNANGLQYLSQAIKTIQEYIAYLQQINQVANKGTLDEYGNTQFADDRTSGWLPTGTSTNPKTAANIGDILQWLQSVYSLNSTSDQNAAYLDSIIQLLSLMQSQQWQQASDDLAYSRTNYNTLVAQYMASGMSRAAAMQAASGSLPSVSGSSVGSIATNVAGGVAADQQAQLTQQANAIAGQQAGTAAFSAINGVWQKQQELENQRYAFENQFFNVEYQKKGINLFKGTLSKYYELLGNGVTIPFDATVDLDKFTKYIQQVAGVPATVSNLCENGDCFIGSKGDLYVTDADGNQVESSEYLIASASDLKQGELFNLLDAEISHNIGEPEYYSQLEQFFFSAAGPRNYYQLDAQYKMLQNQTYLSNVNTKLQSVMANLQTEEFASSCSAAFISAYNHGSDDDKSNYNALLTNAGLSIYEDKVGTWSVADDGTEVFKAASYDDLEKAGLISMGLSYAQLSEFSAKLNALLLDGNPEHFQRQLENLLLKDENDNAFLKLQGAGAKKASKWIQNTNVWSDLAGAKAIFDIIGAGAVLNGIGRFVSGGSNLMSTINNIRNSNRDRSTVVMGYDEHGYYGPQSQTISGFNN